MMLRCPPAVGVCATAGPARPSTSAPRAAHTAAVRKDVIVFPPSHADRRRPGGSSPRAGRPGMPAESPAALANIREGPVALNPSACALRDALAEDPLWRGGRRPLRAP